MENTFWIIISVYFLAIILLGFLFAFHFNRYQFRESVFTFFFAISLLVLSIIIYNALRNTEFGKWVRSRRRGTSDLMTISFWLAFLIALLMIFDLFSSIRLKKVVKKTSKKEFKKESLKFGVRRKEFID